MSKIIEKLVGRECKLVIDAEKNILEDDQVDATILEVDEEWVRFTYLDKKKNIKTKIIRIDAIESIEELEE
ncbi:hypothetical protein lbkm_2200 [Lachnospiraceae bacterium KM106-2]|nr:hypothetical protein lbkm_2200 [Lachnospiraceae bacterium KM106-2]